MSAEPPPPPRSIKPRKPYCDALFVIAVTEDRVCLERTGETHPIEELPAIIVAEPSSMIVAEKMGEHVLALSEAFKDSETFQYKLTPIYRDLHPQNGEVKERAVLRDTTTTLIGFKGNFHHPVDPQSFIRLGIDEIMPGPAPPLMKLMCWGKEVRDFCLANEMRVKPSAGGLASQLLRDRRFYPHARRKAPGMINAKGRERLPGNFYHLYGKACTSYAATYVDMASAHHHIAQKVSFPCANTLHAYGYFSSESNREWAKPQSDRLHEVLKCHGLLHARISVPPLRHGFAPPYMQEGVGQRDAWIFTNEIPLIESLGGKVESVYAAYISPDRDTGLSKYARFAQAQLDEKPHAKPWLKPVLHSAYGVLAGRPRPIEIGWRVANGEPDIYPMGGKVVDVKVVKTTRSVEANIVNTIHRGMIEAEQRCMALELARDLEQQGGTIICVYADSLFVVMPQMPLLPPPWRAKDECTELQFLSATQFVSKQLTRLPGVSRSMERDFRPAGLTTTETGDRADTGIRLFRPTDPIGSGGKQVRPNRVGKE